MTDGFQILILKPFILNHRRIHWQVRISPGKGNAIARSRVAGLYETLRIVPKRAVNGID